MNHLEQGFSNCGTIILEKKKINIQNERKIARFKTFC
jgi:hypothetical protein